MELLKGTTLKPQKGMRDKRVLVRETLDGRSRVAKIYDRLISAVHADLGGVNQLSTIELALIEGFCGASLVLNDINTRIINGGAIDGPLVSMHAQSISAMVRCAAKLGTARRSKLIPSLDDFLAMRARARGEPPKSEIIK
jgi:hypothetical protein